MSRSQSGFYDSLMNQMKILDIITSKFLSEKEKILRLKALYISRVDIIRNDDIKNPLEVASEMNYMRIVKYFVKNGFYKNIKMKSLQSLHYASLNENSEIFYYLLKNGENIRNTRNQDDSLHIAILASDTETAKKIIEENSYFCHIKDCSGSTPLMLSSAKGNLELSKIFVTKGSDINEQNYDGLTAMHFAVQYNRIEVLEFLTKFEGVNLCISDKNGLTAFHYAVILGNKEVVNLMLASFDGLLNYTNQISDSFIFLSLSANHKYSKKNINIPKSCSVSKITPSMMACYVNNLEILTILHDHGAKFQKQDSEGETVLHYAARYSSESTLRYVIKKHSNVNLKNFKGETSLLIATYENDINKINLLLKNFANPNLHDETNSYPIHVASSNRRIDIIKSLINNQALVNVNDIYGNTPLTIAITNQFYDVVICLLDNGADPNYYNRVSNSLILNLAIESDDFKMVEILLEYGANIHMSLPDTNSPYMISKSCANDQIKIIFEIFNFIGLLSQYKDFHDIDYEMINKNHDLFIKHFSKLVSKYDLYDQNWIIKRFFANNIEDLFSYEIKKFLYEIYEFHKFLSFLETHLIKIILGDERFVPITYEELILEDKHYLVQKYKVSYKDLQRTEFLYDSRSDMKTYGSIIEILFRSEEFYDRLKLRISPEEKIKINLIVKKILSLNYQTLQVKKILNYIISSEENIDDYPIIQDVDSNMQSYVNFVLEKNVKEVEVFDLIGDVSPVET